MRLLVVQPVEKCAVLNHPISSPRHCFKPNTNAAPARLVLNYKGIPYKTEWLEYPDLEPTFKSFGIPPNAEGSAYSIPTIRIGDKYVVDSAKIAAELEKQYPSPSLHLGSPALLKVQQLMPKCVEGLKGLFMPKVPSAILNQASVPFWVEKREKRFGMSLAQLEKEQGGEAAWERSTPTIKEFGSILKAEGGPFVLGKTGKAPSACSGLTSCPWLRMRMFRMMADFCNSLLRRLYHC